MNKPDMNKEYLFPDCLCEANRFMRVFLYENPPAGETVFNLDYEERYYREVLRCDVCGHYVSVHNMDMDKLYEGEWVNATYKDEGRMKRTFEHIIFLSPPKSDNAGRVSRLVAFTQSFFSPEKKQSGNPSILDVGSGLSVFLHKMKDHGFTCTALDPDERCAEHARRVVGVEAVCGDFMKVKDLGQHDIITLNKVLEHVKNPVTMLVRTRDHLKSGGFVYIEVPDGEAAEREGPDREEFFVDHYHVFSAVSTAILAARTGFRVQILERLKEPSGKFTIRAFLIPSDQSGYHRGKRHER